MPDPITTVVRLREPGARSARATLTARRRARHGRTAATTAVPGASRTLAKAA